jgi:hypothetical protein
MIRRIAALTLAGLLAATQALASVLVIDYSTASDYSSNLLNAQQSVRVVVGYLNKITSNGGVVVIPYTASKTLWARQGQQVVAWDPGRNLGMAVTQFDYVVHVPWKPGLAATGLNPDSLTLRAGWPTKPQIFVGPTYVPFGKWAQSAACSTGITSNNVGVAPPVLSYAIYSTKGDEVMRTHAIQLNRADAAARPPGIFRGLIAYRQANAFVDASGYTNCTDCDAITRAASASAAESLMVWERDRGAGETAPLIFCDIGAGTFHPLYFAVSCARVDSVTAGAVYQKQVKTAIMISGFYRTNSINPANPEVPGLGPFVPASGTVDTTNLKAGLDSLASLRIPLSVTVATNLDTITALRYQTAWLKKLPTAKLTPQDYAGTNDNYNSTWFSRNVMGVQAGGATSQYLQNDVWGAARATRTWAPSDWKCVTDTSGFCLVRESFDRCDSLAKALGLAGTDHIVWPANGDWTPIGITRGDASALNSVLYYSRLAGVRGFLVTPGALDMSPDVYLSPAAQPLGFGQGAAKLPIRDPSTGKAVGVMTLLASRGQEAGVATDTPAGHDLLGEQMIGWLTDGYWFWSADASITNIPGPLYRHDFFSTVNVLSMSLASFGGSGDGSTPRRFGWWMVKGLVNANSMVNSYSWPGRKGGVHVICYPEDLVP